ncbi:MAG: hypothetical protein QXO82_04775 [Candidatus Methanomethylicia archaeon]
MKRRINIMSLFLVSVISINIILIFIGSVISYDIENVFLLPLLSAMLIAPLLWYIIEFRLNSIIGVITLFLISSLLFISLPNMLPRVFLYMGKEDASTYIGMIIDLVKEGKIPNYNFYPSMFLISSMQTYITNIDVYSATKILALVYNFFFLLLIVILTRTIARSKLSLSILGFTFINIAWYSPSSFYPQFNVIILLLTLIYFVLNDITIKGRNKLTNIILEILIIVVMTFTHPFSIHYIMAIVLAIIFPISIISRKFFPEEVNVRKVSIKIIYLLFVAFILYFLWFFNMYLEGRFSSPRYLLEEIINNVLYFREGIIPVQEDISRSVLGTELLYRGLNVLLDDILLYMIFVIGFISLIKIRDNQRNFLFFVLIAGIICYSILTFMFMLTKLHVPYRITILNLATPLIYIYSIILLDIYRKSSKLKNRLLLHIFTSVFILSYIIGSITLIPSGRISVPFNAIYYSEISFGQFIGTYVDTRSPSTICFTRIFITLYRILDLIYGYEPSRFIIKKEIALSMNYISDINNSSSDYKNILQADLECPTYLVIGEYDTNVYTSLNKPEIANLVIAFRQNVLNRYELLYSSGSLFLLDI